MEACAAVGGEPSHSADASRDLQRDLWAAARVAPWSPSFFESALSAALAAELATCRYGNYSLQLLIAFADQAHLAALANLFAPRAAKLARHKFGCRVVCRLIEQRRGALQCALLGAVAAALAELVEHQYGNFVAQSLLEYAPEYVGVAETVDRVARHWSPASLKQSVWLALAAELGLLSSESRSLVASKLPQSRMPSVKKALSCPEVRTPAMVIVCEQTPVVACGGAWAGVVYSPLCAVPVPLQQHPECLTWIVSNRRIACFCTGSTVLVLPLRAIFGMVVGLSLMLPLEQARPHWRKQKACRSIQPTPVIKWVAGAQPQLEVAFDVPQVHDFGASHLCVLQPLEVAVEDLDRDDVTVLRLSVRPPPALS